MSIGIIGGIDQMANVLYRLKKELMINNMALLFALLLVVNSSFSQNLIKNPIFEKTESCPDESNRQHKQFDVEFGVNDWTQPTCGSPDYYSFCSNNLLTSIPQSNTGFKFPISGHAFVGAIIHNGRIKGYKEFIQGQLLEPLKKDSTYTLDFYLSSATMYRYSLPFIEVILSPYQITSDESDFKASEMSDSTNFTKLHIELDPQMLANGDWIQVRSTFQSKGGESFLTIGNFQKINEYKKRLQKNKKSTSKFAYVYLDNFTLFKFEESKISPPSILKGEFTSSNDSICIQNLDSVHKTLALNQKEKYRLTLKFEDGLFHGEVYRKFYTEVMRMKGMESLIIPSLAYYNYLESKALSDEYSGTVSVEYQLLD